MRKGKHITLRIKYGGHNYGLEQQGQMVLPHPCPVTGYPSSPDDQRLLLPGKKTTTTTKPASPSQPKITRK